MDINQIVKNMTLEEKVGQKIMLDFRYWDQNGSSNKDMTVPDETIGRLITDNHIGGVILFANNLKDKLQIKTLTAWYAAMKTCGDIRLFIGTDNEGGNVFRLPRGDYASFPGNMALSAAIEGGADIQLAYEQGAQMAQDMLSLHINTNFAPVVDVNTNPFNPVINVRSFSDDVSTVSLLAEKMAAGMRQQNLITAYKHFPGHGSTSTDSHTGLPCVDRSRKDAFAIDIAPYKHAIDSHVAPDMIMTAHIQYPALDNSQVITRNGMKITVPATMSREIQTHILRAELGFTGVTISDALDMGAITDNFDRDDAIERVFTAGVDIALMPVSISSPSQANQLPVLVQGIVEKIRQGIISETDINTSVERILRLKKNYSLYGDVGKDRSLYLIRPVLNPELGVGFDQNELLNGCAKIKLRDPLAQISSNDLRFAIKYSAEHHGYSISMTGPVTWDETDRAGNLSVNFSDDWNQPKNLWTFDRVGDNEFIIRNLKDPSMVWDVHNYYANYGTNIKVTKEKSNNDPVKKAQIFRIDMMQDNKCFVTTSLCSTKSISTTDNDNNVIVWEHDNGERQQFYIYSRNTEQDPNKPPVYIYQMFDHKKEKILAWNVPGGKQLFMHPNENKKEHFWNIELQCGGDYIISNHRERGRVVDVTDAKINNGNILHVESRHPSTDNAAQRFRLHYMVDNTPVYFLRPELEKKIADRSITVVINRQSTLPLTDKNQHYFILTPWGEQAKGIAAVMSQDGYMNVMAAKEADLTDKQVREYIAACDVFLLGTLSTRYSPVEEDGVSPGGIPNTSPDNHYLVWLRYAAEQGKKRIHLSLRAPYDIVNYADDVDAAVAAYSYYGYDSGVWRGLSMISLAEILTNKRPPQGKLPINTWHDYDVETNTGTVAFPRGYGLEWS
ncbi:glycoside hydrolase family 3 N-terminal domain-containing protein [Kosakonia oryziphila]|uniref:beta-N-acetylhexosaminidase n=1 Tax=Kosakonia oryziphila TaxID=1005667 RepID=A0A1C4GAW2_9ENTR|nr:glycoside hydrolase family 3 N-terminal domain-containing protein [Kosakonia oryziphila]SCC65327.1 beta-glucosidase [Kosakonia oryziphila]